MPPRIAARMKLIARRAQIRAVRTNRFVASLLATSVSDLLRRAVLFKHFVRASLLTALRKRSLVRIAHFS